MYPSETIKLEGQMLRDGESRRILCPYCNGGRSRESSMILTRDGPSIKAWCFRASCQRGTKIVSSTTRTDEPAKAKVPRRYDGATYFPSDGTFEYLYNKYHLTEEMCTYYDLRENEDGDIVIPTWGPTGVRSGWIVRRRNKTPKVLSFVDMATHGSWYHPAPLDLRATKDYAEDTVILVEDVFSAMRANGWCASIAILGSYVHKDLVQSLASPLGSEYKRIILALDPDARASEAGQVRQLRGLLPGIRPGLLRQDLKDMSEKEFHGTMNGLINPDIGCMT